jgi:hypothetical protein
MGQQLSNSEAQHFRNSARQQFSKSAVQQLHSSSAPQHFRNSTRQQFSKSAAQQLRNSAMDAHYCETLLGLCPGYVGDNLPVLCWPVDYLTPDEVHLICKWLDLLIWRGDT